MGILTKFSYVYIYVFLEIPQIFWKCVLIKIMLKKSSEFCPGLGPINKILRKIPQNFHLILRFLKSAHIKIPYTRYSEFCPASYTKICQKKFQIVSGKLENSNSEDFFWEFVDRANFMTKNLKILVQLAEKIMRILSKEFW